MGFLLLFFSTFALSAEPENIRLTCVTEVPTTTFAISTENDQVLATVVHHFGSRYAPAISGVFTPNDLPILQERAKLVEKMLPRTTFRWPLERCKKTGTWLFQCFGSKDVQEGVGGVKLTPTALYTSTTSEDGLAGKQEYLTVHLAFQVDGKGDPSVRMKYPRSDCAL